VQGIAPLVQQDWVRLTQSQFEPVAIEADFWIVPTWHDPPRQASHVIRLDPGLAFGTGTHPTTALCLAELDGMALEGRCVVDYGCGSGILAVAALKLGARAALGVDNDPQALVACRSNADRYGIARETLTVQMPGAAPLAKADLVVANILAGPLLSLADTLLDALQSQPFDRHLTAGSLVLILIDVEQLGQAEVCHLGYATGRHHHVGRLDGEPMFPADTLASRTGACRDTAMLYVAACRSLGLAARFVSGYSMHHPEEVSEHELHAWAEVYLPGAGWRGYDPSLGLAVADGHVVLAAAPDHHLAAAVSGSYRGTGVASTMRYAVEVRTAPTLEELQAFDHDQPLSLPPQEQWISEPSTSAHGAKGS
jgi:SAM-dependent methyltransferase